MPMSFKQKQKNGRLQISLAGSPRNGSITLGKLNLIFVLVVWLFGGFLIAVFFAVCEYRPLG